ncbi:MAG: histidinol dehydrogenase [Candidatus Bathyarchaeota archaeon]|nr:histidinol dehydrogenase [Candidatus Bathyarchaeota archaeon]
MRTRLEIKVWKARELPLNWFKRKAIDDTDSEAVENSVKEIIGEVQKRGNTALIEFTDRFDKTKLTARDLQVSTAEIKAAYKTVSQQQVNALKLMRERLFSNEKRALRQIGYKTSREGISIQNVMRPIESVGCYVPAGQAVYPSTLVMTTTPAKVAGVQRIVVCSPPTSKGTINPLILVAADICQVNEVYKVGGVQAIAALAYGTETIKPVKKIVGPGSKYVTAAKVQVSKDVAIDMPAGPSEVLILADEKANPKLVAADMISQAEHGTDSVAGLITPSRKLVDAVLRCLDEQSAVAERREIVEKALSTHGFIIVCKDDPEEIIALANAFAPEHLEIMTEKPKDVADRITSAGLILMGPYSPVALSDYGSGTNHVLPTGGFGSVYSGLSALDFMRRVSIVESTKEGLEKIRSQVKVLTEAENLPNHCKAVEARFENES